MLSIVISRKTVLKPTRSEKKRLARFTASQSDRVVGALATALQAAQTATEPRRCRPRRKRLCKQHKLPIIRRRWWSGYRNKGCARCFKVPPPEERLCRKHGRPIQPSAWLRGRHSTGCGVCFRNRPSYTAAKARYRARLRQRLLRAKRRKRGQAALFSKKTANRR
jgi:hypothetical protein